MASYGLLGAIGGVGKGMEDYGKAMMVSALEEAREQRLEEARERAEQRAIAEEEKRSERDLVRTYGEEAARKVLSGEAGTKNMDEEVAVRQARALIPVEVEAAQAMVPIKTAEEQRLHQQRLAEQANRARLGVGEDGGLLKPSAAITTVEWLAKHVTGGDYQEAWAEYKRNPSNPQERIMTIFEARRKESRDISSDAYNPEITDEKIMEGVIRDMDTARRLSARLGASPPGTTNQKAPKPSQPPQDDGELPRITTDQEYDQLPSGAVFMGLDGKRYRKP